MKLILGLGNPGEKYLLSPHNIGWILIDAFAHFLNTSYSLKKKLFSEITESQIIEGQKILLAKPMTYMNLSGIAVKNLMDYYPVSLDNLLVIHDDTDLPFLNLRFQKNRGPAGHNGLKSINQELNSQDYTRLRIGMKALEPLQKRQVLKPFTKTEQELLPDFLNKAILALKYFIKEGLEKSANLYNK